MANEIVKVTERFGYRRQKNHIYGEVFAVYHLKRNKNEIVSAFVKESRAKQECRYLEKLNYGDKEDGK